MNKILVKVNCDSDLELDVYGFILGIKDFSLGFGKVFLSNDVKEIIKGKNNKKIFVSLNRPILNNELDMYKKSLKELDSLGIDGIIVGDIAALTYDLKTDLVLDQMHLNNSYLTINHYYKKGIKYFYLTNDITYNEINEIKENTKALLLKDVFCLPHLSTSKRMLISNYKKHFNIVDNSSFNYIKEKNSNNYYLIKEDLFGTSIYANPINLLSEIDKIKADYFIINGYLIEDDIKEIVNAFVNNDKDKEDDINKKYNAEKYFIDKKTIYKVKDK